MYARCVNFAYFQSIIRFTRIILGNCPRVKEILILQKHTVKVMAKADPRNCKPLYIEVQIPTIFNQALYILINPALLTIHSNSHNYNTQSNNMKQFNFIVCKSLNSPIVLSIKIHNALKLMIKSLSLLKS